MAKKKPVKFIDQLKPEALIAKVKKLKSDRGTWESHWQEISDYIVPRKNTITNTKSPGQKRTWQLLDNTGMHSNELLGGTLHSLLTNTATEFFEGTTGNAELDKDEEVRKWFQKEATNIHNVLNNSNFQPEVHELYTDLPSFGTSCIMTEEDDKKVVRFSTKFIGDYYIDENNVGLIDQVYRTWKWNASQMCSEFGYDNLPEKVQKAFDKQQDTLWTIHHGVYPKSLINHSYKGKMEYTSQYVLEETKENIKIGEYHEFPYGVPRWSKAPGEKYGRGPGMTALPEMKVLNKMNETMLKGAQKIVDPPIEMPDDGYVMPLATQPGGINYKRAGNPDDRIRPIFNDTRIDWGDKLMQDIRKRVRDAFYVDQLKLSQDQKYMTAQEVMQRTQESMRLLGPMLGRMETEFLRPVIDRVYRIMWDRGLISKPPEKLSGVKFEFRYSSLIAKSQRVNEGQAVLQVIQAMAPFIQLDPNIAMNFDGDAILRALVVTYGAPQIMLKDRKVVEAQRKADAQMKAQQAAKVGQAENQALEQGQNTNTLQFVQAAKEAQSL